MSDAPARAHGERRGGAGGVPTDVAPQAGETATAVFPYGGVKCQHRSEPVRTCRTPDTALPPPRPLGVGDGGHKWAPQTIVAQESLHGTDVEVAFSDVGRPAVGLHMGDIGG